jgi:hypothetical protein
MRSGATRPSRPVPMPQPQPNPYADAVALRATGSRVIAREIFAHVEAAPDAAAAWARAEGHLG